MAIYGDQIRMLSEQKLLCRIPGDTVNSEVSIILYEFKGKAIEAPKSIFEGAGGAQLSAFERHMQPHVAVALENAPKEARLVAVDIPVLDSTGTMTKIKIVVAREPLPFLERVRNINSWWVSEDNLKNVSLLAPAPPAR